MPPSFIIKNKIRIEAIAKFKSSQYDSAIYNWSVFLEFLKNTKLLIKIWFNLTIFHVIEPNYVLLTQIMGTPQSQMYSMLIKTVIWNKRKIKSVLRYI